MLMLFLHDGYSIGCIVALRGRTDRRPCDRVACKGVGERRREGRRVPATGAGKSPHQAVKDREALDAPAGRLSQCSTFPRLVFQKQGFP